MFLESYFNVYIIIMYFVYMFGVMLIFLYMLCMFVLMRVDEQATEDPGLQLVETAEQELVEGKLCP
jgi:ammonia channel protein AmtB